MKNIKDIVPAIIESDDTLYILKFIFIKEKKNMIMGYYAIDNGQYIDDYNHTLMTFIDTDFEKLISKVYEWCKEEGYL
jgi:hypothetical protein